MLLTELLLEQLAGPHCKIGSNQYKFAFLTLLSSCREINIKSNDTITNSSNLVVTPIFTRYHGSIHSQTQERIQVGGYFMADTPNITGNSVQESIYERLYQIYRSCFRKYFEDVLNIDHINNTRENSLDNNQSGIDLIEQNSSSSSYKLKSENGKSLLTELHSIIGEIQKNWMSNNSPQPLLSSNCQTKNEKEFQNTVDNSNENKTNLPKFQKRHRKQLVQTQSSKHQISDKSVILHRYMQRRGILPVEPPLVHHNEQRQMFLRHSFPTGSQTRRIEQLEHNVSEVVGSAFNCNNNHSNDCSGNSLNNTGTNTNDGLSSPRCNPLRLDNAVRRNSMASLNGFNVRSSANHHSQSHQRRKLLSLRWPNLNYFNVSHSNYRGNNSSRNQVFRHFAV